MKIEKWLLLSLLWLIPALWGCDKEKKRNDTRESVNSGTNIGKKEKAEARKIVFFGNSLTAGYGVEAGEAFPALIQEKLDSLGLNYTVINAGLSGETTASGKNRIAWVLEQGVDIFVLELGGNDGLRGIDPDETRRNLQEMIDYVQEEFPDAKIILAGMQIPPNMGDEYTKRFRDIYPELARKNDLTLIPFLLEDVGGESDLNQPDGIHPNAKGHKIVAENVWEVLKEVVVAEGPATEVAPS